MMDLSKVSKFHWTWPLLIVALAVGLFIWRAPAQAPAPTDGLWQTTTNGQGVRFEYPVRLTTTYTSIVNVTEGGPSWPPQIKVQRNNSGTVQCSQPTRRVDDREYCVERVNEGAAGSTYTDYVYSTIRNGQLITVAFTLRAVQCANYDAPRETECEGERQTFDLDGVVDRIVRSIRQ